RLSSNGCGSPPISSARSLGASSATSRKSSKRSLAATGASVIGRLEVQCQAVHTIALARGCGTIVEHVAEVATATCTLHFRADHSMGPVDLLVHAAAGDGRGEAWPPRA